MDTASSTQGVRFNGWSALPDGPGYRYCNGERCNGEIIDRFEDGRVKESGFYINGSLHGICKEFHSDGSLRRFTQYDHGKRIGHAYEFYENGRLESHEIWGDKSQIDPLLLEWFFPNGGVSSITRTDSIGFFTYDLELNETGDTIGILSVYDDVHSIYKRVDYHDDHTVWEEEYYEYQNEISRVGTSSEYDTNGTKIKDIFYSELPSSETRVDPRTALYDSAFIAYWNYIKPLPIRFSDDSIIVDNKEVIYIPLNFPLNQLVSFSAEKGDTNYTLHLVQVNYTDIRFTLVTSIDTSYSFYSGICTLEPTFHLGSEGVYQDSNGNVFEMVDYNFKHSSSPGKLQIAVGTNEIVELHMPDLVLQLRKVEHEKSRAR